MTLALNGRLTVLGPVGSTQLTRPERESSWAGLAGRGQNGAGLDLCRSRTWFRFRDGCAGAVKALPIAWNALEFVFVAAVAVTRVLLGALRSRQHAA
jgi:hypothetical protein